LEKILSVYSKKDILLPELKINDIVMFKCELLEKETKPPKMYTQGDLINLMENLGIGTKSTRQEIIKKLYERDYITDKIPHPTTIGIILTELLSKYANLITDPKLTHQLEDSMELITENKKSFDEIVVEGKKMLHQILNILEKNKLELEKDLMVAILKSNNIGKCNVCGNDLRVIAPHKKRFVGCTNYPKCKNSYPLPQKGKINFLNELCACGAPKIKYNRKIFCINLYCETKNK